MNKLLKGTVAGAAGLTLLLGGAGTYAFWNDSVAIDSAAVTAGTLKITPASVGGVDTPGTWSYTQGGTTVAIPDITTFLVVPGTELTYTREMKISASGDGLTASLSVTQGSIGAANSAVPADNALAAEMSNTAVVSISGIDSAGIVVVPSVPVDPADPTGPVAPAVNSAFTVSTIGGPVSDDVTVSVKLTFPNTASEQNAAQAGKVKLNDIGIALAQTAPTAP